MSVGSIGVAVSAASSLLGFRFRQTLSGQDGMASVAARDDRDDDAEDTPDPEQQSLFRAVETALREAGYLDA